mmetsp:Transcript_13198/g.18524  ORF Transcript_13198/g.18524 Transcript_13198/m.18524 type:complete len:207 (-) Transcript_13198:77-697(-)
MIKSASERGVNREAFVVGKGGFDAHAGVMANLDDNLPDVNNAVGGFYRGLKDINMLDNVTTIIISEFGRTISPNTNDGSDHGWGGNYFIFGGGIRGKKIYGEYPASFRETDKTMLDRGRVLPTRSWDSLWYAVSQWFGVDNNEDMDYVIPNNQNFGCDLIPDSVLYKNGVNKVSGCSGESVDVQVTVYTDEARRFTGEEQKSACSE